MSLYDKVKSFFIRVFGHSTPQVLIKMLVENPKLMPSKAHWDDSGYDLRSAEIKPIIIRPGETTIIPCGFAMEIPVGYEAQIRPRSGLAIKHGITVLNTPGTIDCGYRGEVKVILTNFGKNDFKIAYTNRIAQMVISKVPNVSLISVSKLHQSGRNENGFGSSGTN